MPITNWEISQEEHELAVRVATRAHRDMASTPIERRVLIMDLVACHCNGCPLDFKGLLKASPQDFSHDISGIHEHINRDTGKLEDFFMPRYALANQVPEVLP